MDNIQASPGAEERLTMSENDSTGTPVHDRGSTDDCSGEMVSIYKHELQLLRRIAESSSDFVLGTFDREFASLNGGQDSLFDIMATQVKRHADWLSEFYSP